MPANSNLIKSIFGAAAVIILFFVLHTASHAAADKNNLWQTANAQYARKQYDSAAAGYEKLLQQGMQNAEVHYNLGNAYYRLNKVGAAILHYEKALHLDPHNKQVSDNLALAKGRVLNPLPEFPPIFFIRWWNGLVQAFSPDVWASLSFLTFCAVLAVIYFARTRREQFRHSGRWLSVSVVALLVFGCMAFFTYDARENSRKAVVMQAGVSFFDSPRSNGKALGTLPEGTVVLINQEEDSYYNVKLPNGREGWIAIHDLSKV